MANNSGFTQKIWDKKLPQYVGSYLAIGFGLLQFIEFVVRRYGLKNELVDGYLVLWLTLLPAVALYFYFKNELSSLFTKGKRGLGILLLINLLLSFILSGYFFFKSEKHQSQEPYTATSITAAPATSAKVKSIALFPFQNRSIDPELDWMRVAIPNLLDFNLEQDPTYYVLDPYDLNAYYHTLEIDDFSLPSVATQREIAIQSNKNYFTKGAYVYEAPYYTMDISLFKTFDGNEVFNTQVRTTSFFDGLDTLRNTIYRHLGSNTSDSIPLLPSSSLISDQTEVLQILANIFTREDKNDFAAMIDGIDNALAIDKRCSKCLFWKSGLLFAQKKQEEAMACLKTGIKYGKVLPERMQYEAKSFLYRSTNNIEALWRLHEIHRKQYPHDFTPYKELLPKYISEKGLNQGIALMQEAIDNGIIVEGHQELYDTYMDNKMYIEAENTLDQLYKILPQRKVDKMKYVSLYHMQGKLTQAKKLLLEEETKDPTGSEIQRLLIENELRNRNFIDVEKRIENGIASSTNRIDSIIYKRLKAQYLQKRGRITESIQENDEIRDIELSHVNSVNTYHTNFLSNLFPLLSIGHYGRVKEDIKHLGTYSREYHSLYACRAHIIAFAQQLPVESIGKDIDCDQILQQYIAGYSDYYTVLSLYMEENYTQCLSILESKGDKLLNLFQARDFVLADIYFHTGNHNKAEQILQKRIDTHTDQAIYYAYMAKFLTKKDPATSKKYWAIANEFWQDADESFIPNQRNKATGRALKIQ